MHLGWNFFENVAFGFPVSGLDIHALTIIQVYGPEAGLIILPVLLVGTGLKNLYSKNRGTSD